jgi:hypothetical protein
MDELTGEVVPAPEGRKPFQVRVRMKGRLVATVEVPTQEAGEAFLARILPMLRALRDASL